MKTVSVKISPQALDMLKWIKGKGEYASVSDAILGFGQHLLLAQALKEQIEAQDRAVINAQDTIKYCNQLIAMLTNQAPIIR